MLVCFLSLLTAYLVIKLQLQNDYSQTNRWLVCLISYYQPNSLLPLQTVYLTKFSNDPKLITHLHLYKARVTLPRTFSNSTAENYPSRFNRDSLFYSDFSSNKPLFGVAVVGLVTCFL